MIMTVSNTGVVGVRHLQFVCLITLTGPETRVVLTQHDTERKEGKDTDNSSEHQNCGLNPVLPFLPSMSC